MSTPGNGSHETRSSQQADLHSSPGPGNGFKAINDTHGHAAGDAVLRCAACGLGDAVDGRGPVGRLGGDEFAAVVPIPAPAGVPWLLRGLHEVLTTPTHTEGRTLTVGASIGACWTGELPAPTLPLALRRADEAMYVVKRGGGGWLAADGTVTTRGTVNGRRAGRGGTHADRDGGAA
ncbi:GGDEF domain-containing protein [Streptomyces sp. NPDC005438]|uniref:GGDEF domain-containing protein n=1 Tax=Streptomyces sp. NPDC005438 TaxID=3156880 RepID=UPI0033ADAC95